MQAHLSEQSDFPMHKALHATFVSRSMMGFRPRELGLCACLNRASRVREVRELSEFSPLTLFDRGITSGNHAPVPYASKNV